VPTSSSAPDAGTSFCSRHTDQEVKKGQVLVELAGGRQRAALLKWEAQRRLALTE